MKRNNKIVIVGAGPAGLFAAYKLCKNNDIIIIDKGKSIYNRICPIREGHDCVNCKPCNIMCGFGGAGTYSDCKLSLSPYGVGGDIVNYIGGKLAEKYTKKVCKIFNNFDKESQTRKVIGKKNKKYKEIEKKLNSVGLDLTYCPTKHLGTDGTYNVMCELFDYLLSKNVKFLFETEVTDFEKYKNKINEEKIKLYTNNISIKNIDKLIFAPGRSGNSWLCNIMKKHNVKTVNNGFDIGFRIEVPYDSVSELTDNLYDMKVSYTDKDGYKTRTFCTNPKGFVSEEHYDDCIALANGHSYADKKSLNTNFAVLVHTNLPTEIGKKIIKDFNNKNNKHIVMSTWNEGFTQRSKLDCTELVPTLNVCKVKDFKNLIDTPFNFVDKVKDFLIKLSVLYPVVGDFTNIYGLEAKFYSDRIKVKSNFETSINNVYCIGDGSGTTRGIIQSCIEGLVVADDISK